MYLSSCFDRAQRVSVWESSFTSTTYERQSATILVVFGVKQDIDHKKSGSNPTRPKLRTMTVVVLTMSIQHQCPVVLLYRLPLQCTLSCCPTSYKCPLIVYHSQCTRCSVGHTVDSPLCSQLVLLLNYRLRQGRAHARQYERSPLPLKVKYGR